MRIEVWRYEDGRPRKLGAFTSEPIPAGYYCRAYPTDKDEFEHWLDETFGTDEARVRRDFKFNSGSPAYFMYFRDEADAMLFRLKWTNG